MDKFEAMKKLISGDQAAREILEHLEPEIYLTKDTPYESYRHSIRKGDDRIRVTLDHPFI